MGASAGAVTEVVNGTLVGTWRQGPMSSGMDTLRRMRAVSVRAASAEAFVHAFGAVTNPVIVCTPFL